MYDVYKRSLENLNFRASHDEMTGAYNRAGYKLLLPTIDRNTTYILLFDVDTFKGINDQYRHQTGDRVLARFVYVLKKNFRADDYICRIGGDEFVVILKGVTEEELEEKEKQLREAALKYNGLVFAVGHACVEKASDVRTALRLADERMYEDKKKYYGSHPEKKGR